MEPEGEEADPVRLGETGVVFESSAEDELAGDELLEAAANDELLEAADDEDEEALLTTAATSALGVAEFGHTAGWTGASSGPQ